MGLGLALNMGAKMEIDPLGLGFCTGNGTQNIKWE